jgi:hypothetical protein
MKIYPRDPDLSTIYNRIRDKTIDLQPDFQRDLVWNLSKKQSLIDTILRQWQFPPVFLVVSPVSETLDVLDGQQRLNAIFEFLEDGFQVDGNIEPTDAEIQKLDGLRYSQLPLEVKNRFGRYSIRVCELSDYKEEEPYELFFRLNQGTVLTPAEKRNTLYGPVREQVRSLVKRMDLKGLNIEKIGFNNNRLAYQDVISRFLFALEKRFIGRKITDQMLVDFFRSGKGVSDHILNQAIHAIDLLAEIIDKKVRLNKPLLLTWLLFLSFDDASKDFFYNFDDLRNRVKYGEYHGDYLTFILDLFQEKSATSVNDAIPVQLRLLIIYLVGISLGICFSSQMAKTAHKIDELFSPVGYYTEDELVKIMIDSKWGLE